MPGYKASFKVKIEEPTKIFSYSDYTFNDGADIKTL